MSDALYEAFEKTRKIGPEPNFMIMHPSHLRMFRVCIRADEIGELETVRSAFVAGYYARRPSTKIKDTRRMEKAFREFCIQIAEEEIS